MAIEGPLRELGIHDVFQLLDLSRKTGALRVTSDLRDDEGVVLFDGGRVIHASVRSHPTTGEVLPVAQITNSRLTHVPSIAEHMYAADRSETRPPGVGSRPGSPKSTGSTAVHPIAATRPANSSTFGVIPGISAITITAGPDPGRRTSRVTPSWVNVPRSKPPRS